MGVHLVVNKGYTSSTAIYGAYNRFKEAVECGQSITILYFGDHDPSGLDMIRDINDRLLFMFKNGDKSMQLRRMIAQWCDEVDGDMLWDKYSGDDDNWYKDEDGQEHMDVESLFFKENFKVRPIGLTMEQIEMYRPPHNPAKITDPRAKKYVRQFGQKSWEVDALRPDVMERIVQDSINEEIDVAKYNLVITKEEIDREKIRTIVDDLNDEQD